MVRRTTSFRALAIALLALCVSASAQTPAPAGNFESRIDSVIQDTLRSTGVPSASVAVVRDGKVAYNHAFGYANLENKTPAQPSMRYSIGSNSKQFTATAILLLQEAGKLSLDDKVGKYIPDLTRANEITIRQILSMTSGYQDDWPQDYVMPEMLGPTTPQHILDKWAKIPLDFEPGTKWQYSNTNYAIAGQIIQKVAGMSYFQYLNQKVFTPLALKSIVNVDEGKLTASDPTGYMRYALGPLRPAPKEGAGWLYAMGELAMTAEDLAKWDISMMNEQVLKPASYRVMQTDTLLKNGVATGYGLGVSVGMRSGHRMVAHTGEVSGFVSANTVFPDDKAAIVVLTNQDANGAASTILGRISEVLFQGATSPKETETAKQVLASLQQGKIDRSLFTDNCNAYYNDIALKDSADSLGPLGAATEFTELGESLRGGMTARRFRAVAGGKTLNISTFWMPNGKIEQYIVTGRE